MKFNFSNSESSVKTINHADNYGIYAHLQFAGIYQIKCKINNKVYIGASNNICNRLSKHFSELSLNKHTNSKLQDDFNKYGKDNFIFDVVEKTTDLKEREIYHQTQYIISILYNEKISGVYMSDELRAKHSHYNKETHKTEEYRNKMVKLKTKYKVVKFTFNGEPIEEFESIELIREKYPDYKVNTIRGVCNGSKKSYKGFLWRYIDKEGNLILLDTDK